MDEIDAKLAIYRWNLGQNSRWNLKLSFKINFGRWITIWKQSGRWISLLTLGFKSGRRITIWKQSGHWISLLTLGFKSGHWINTGVIWAVRSRWRERGDFSPKIGDISPINRRHTEFSGDFLIKSPIYPVSPIFWRFLAKNRLADLSPPFVVSPPADTRYINDISPIFFRFFPPWLWLCLVSRKSKEKKIKRKSRRKIKKMNLKSIHYFYMVLQRLIFFYYIKIK